MNRGYTGIIGNEFVFVVANSIGEATTKISEKANGQRWELDNTRHCKILK